MGVASGYRGTGPATMGHSVPAHLEHCWQYSESFPVGTGLHQGYPLSPILFITFTNRISRRSQGVEGVQISGLKIASLLFADEVLLASLSCEHQLALEQFTAECEAAGMRISTSKPEDIVLSWERMYCLLRVRDELLPHVEEFRDLGVLFTSGERMEQEIDRWIGAVSAATQLLYQSVVVKRELSQRQSCQFTGRFMFQPSPMATICG